jgi:DNA invertase Pin-like site-specific DNA recombinase
MDTHYKKVRVVTYSRVSTSHHDQKPEIQREHLKAFCEARGWTIVEEIVDHGFSGGSDNRPGFKRLMSLVRQREVDAVVVVKLDRLFRSLRHLVVTLEEFQALGILFVASRDAIDWSTPAGRFFGQVLGSLAELEKSILVERTLMGLEHARSRGKTLGRPRLKVENQVVALREQGLTYAKISERLKISQGSVRNYLKRNAQKTGSKSDPS